MAKKESQTVDFHYIKNNNYKTFYANGVFGGITPRGELQMDFFIERQVIPQLTTQNISNEGKLGDIKNTKGKKGFVREIDCGILLNIETAISFHQWLGEKIDEYSEIKKNKEE